MKITRFLSFLFYLFSLAATAQTATDTETIFTEAASQLYTDTDKALKSATYLLQNATNTTDKANAQWLLAAIYSFKGEYPKTADLLFEAKSIAESSKLKYRILTAIAAQCRLAGLTDKATAYTKEAQALGIFKSNMLFGKNPIHEKAEQLLVKEVQPENFIQAILPLLPGLQKSQDILLKTAVYKKLAGSYLALGNDARYKTYNELYDQYNDSSTDQKEKARVALLNNIDKDYELVETADIKNYSTMLIVIGGTLFLLVCVGGLYLRGLSRDYGQYQKIISGLEAAETEKAAEAIQEARIYSMPEKTERGLLEKLERFEESERFLSRSISLNTLAKQLDTNTKYLSEIINTHKSGNFNAYINELRVKHILKKLQTEPVYLNYKVSYLAEESGFSSHSAFATVFKCVTGISPTTYISFLKKETESLVTHEPEAHV